MEGRTLVREHGEGISRERARNARSMDGERGIAEQGVLNAVSGWESRAEH